MSEAPDDAAPTFEDSIDEIEGIIERIENGQTGLEQCIGEYERGMKLIARCRTILSAAERRIAELVDGPDGPRIASPADGGGDDRDGSPDAGS